MNNEREVAVRVLIEILGSNAYNNIALRKALADKHLSDNIKKNFVTELVNGVIRNLIFIDYVISLRLKTEVTKVKLPVLCIIRTGVYQILFMDRVPESAACNESVNLAKVFGFRNLSGFVNAVLRGVCGIKGNIPMPGETDEPLKYLSLKYSYPAWLINRFMNELSYDVLKKMLGANSLPPDVSICVNINKTNPKVLADKLAGEGVGVSAGRICENALRLTDVGDIRKLNCFKEGLFHVMDESSMLAVEALGITPGQTLIDVCAAPGGKSFYAAGIMQNKGKIIARDIHSHKIELIKEGASRLGVDIIDTEPADASVFEPRLEGKADRLLIDAPCTGLGLIRKKPDIKYSKSEEDIVALSALQRKILSACHKYLKTGGLMVYSTCTLTKEENESNVRWFASEYGYRPEPPESSVFSKYITGDGFIRLIPGDNITDGFFIAALRRN